MAGTKASHVQRAGCHCGTVTFEVELPNAIEVHECNCSMCRTVGYQHAFVDADRFRLLTGDDALVDYRFNTGVARHRFCGVCGVKTFYIPRSHPDGVSVNFRCLDEGRFESVKRVPFDGANWEANIDGLRARDS